MSNSDGTKRLLSFIKRAEAGEELVLGFFGGSITQGSLASTSELCYAHRVFDYFVKKYPQAKFHYVNAGIGGTSSQFGVARVHDDLLMYRPDFVVIDFSVNDEDERLFQETFEGLIRKIWYSDTKPAIIILNNVFYDDGRTIQNLHNEVGDYYGIPHVSIKETVYSEIQRGKYTREQITPDGLHPNDFGHGLVADEIIDVINGICEAGPRLSDDSENTVKAPITSNRFEDCVRYTIINAQPELRGFRADPCEKMGHLDFFKNGWTGTRAGDTIRFELKDVKSIAIQYRKTIQRPAPVACAVIDGNESEKVILDSNFEEDWGDCLYLQTVMDSDVTGNHVLEIRITEAKKEDQNNFYLLSVITA